MIPKVHKRQNFKHTKLRDFADTVSYCAGKADAVELVNLAGEWIDAAWQMSAVAAGNTRAKRPAYHLTLSWAPLERPTNEQVLAAARQCLRELGLEDHQAVLAVHRDKEHVHVHILLNRVHPVTGKAFRTAHDYLRLELACRRIELAQGWSVDRGGFDSRVVDGDIELVPWTSEELAHDRQNRVSRRDGRVTFFDRLSDVALADIRRAISRATQWSDLHARLARLGLLYMRHGSGARICLRGTREVFKPSLLGPGFGFSVLVQRLGVFAPAPPLPHLTMNGRRDCTVTGEPAAADAAATASCTFQRAILTRFYVAITSDSRILNRLERIDLRERARVLLKDGTCIKDVGSGVFGKKISDPDLTARLMVAMTMAKGWTNSTAHGSEAFESAFDRASDHWMPEGNVEDALVAWMRNEKERGRIHETEIKRRQEWNAERKRQAARKQEVFATVGRQQDSVSRLLRALVERFHLEERTAFGARCPRQLAPAPQVPPDFVAVKPVRPPQLAPAADHTTCRQYWMDDARVGAGHPWAKVHGFSEATLARFSANLRAGPDGSVLMAHTNDAGSIVGFECHWRNDAGQPRMKLAKGGLRRTLVLGDANRARRVVVCASGLDALALAEFEARRDTLYISTVGWSAAIETRLGPVLRERSVAGSFTTRNVNLNKQLHAKLAGLAPSVERIVPPSGAATWAEHLTQRAERYISRRASPAQPHPETLEPALWNMERCTAAAQRGIPHDFAKTQQPVSLREPAEPDQAPAVWIVVPDAETYRAFVAWKWPRACDRPPLRPAIEPLTDPHELARRAIRDLDEGRLAEVILVAASGFASEDLPSHPSLHFVISGNPQEGFVEVLAPDPPCDPEPEVFGF